ncbi:WD40/YVTN/BNR-like repeat-containing protein [Microlunatus soli]|uniref:BNR/Asp-box repeat-containing protein n=1 Tax=Microlunatus soli TaxID=630515 RepID=A0A1H1VEI1_9ACTN|nr:sialidase family protein [Microlunatus soli]SDS83182.1 BNR/Asp-box repeat-containing protein [Microlunatus soli]
MSEAVLLVGTRKGLWIGRSDERRSSWTFGEPEFLMEAVYGIGVDTRGGAPRIFVSGTSEHWGPGVYYSDDLGRTWTETQGAAVRFSPEIGASVERVWQIQPGSEAEPDVIYAGTQPSALFRSADRGESFQLITALWDHPHREHWNAGYGGQAIHTVVPDPKDPAHLTVAMSTGGVYRTADSGQSWSPANVGIKAYFMPDPWPEYGQCVHKVTAHPAHPERMYAQNHHGVYRSDDAGENWIPIADGLPSDFGFPIVVHPQHPDTVYVFPLIADGRRIPPEGKARVWRSTDAGASWTALAGGLPDSFYAAVMRDAFCADNADRAGLYLGARDGTVYASADDGDHWQQLAAHLPDVYSVRAVVA